MMVSGLNQVSIGGYMMVYGLYEVPFGGYMVHITWPYVEGIWLICGGLYEGKWFV